MTADTDICMEMWWCVILFQNHCIVIVILYVWYQVIVLYSRGRRGWLLSWMWGYLDYCWGICRVDNVAHVEHLWISLIFHVPVSFCIFTVLTWSCEVGFGTCCTPCKCQLTNLCYFLCFLVCNTYVMTCLFVPLLLHWIEVTPNCFCRVPTLKCTACYWCL